MRDCGAEGPLKQSAHFEGFSPAVSAHAAIEIEEPSAHPGGSSSFRVHQSLYGAEGVCAGQLKRTLPVRNVFLSAWL